MNERNVSQLLALMSAAWPAHQLPPGTPTVWAAQLENTHPADARAAAEALIRADQFFPSVGRFLQTTHGFARRRRDAEARERGLQAAQEDRALPMSENAARAQAARDQLRGGTS